MSEPLKKEFIATWYQESLHLNTDRMPITNQYFFDRSLSFNGVATTEAMLPMGIFFRDLVGFAGKKTKVTIEVIE